MACRRPGDKPLSEPMMVRLSTHICVTRPQWVNDLIKAMGRPSLWQFKRNSKHAIYMQFKKRMQLSIRLVRTHPNITRENLGFRLLMRINFNLSMHRQSHESVGYNYFSIPKLHQLHRWICKYGLVFSSHALLLVWSMRELNLIHIFKRGPWNIYLGATYDFTP